MRLIIVFLTLALLGLQYKLWIADGSILQWIQLGKKVEHQAQENEIQWRQNHAMEIDIQELKRGDQALEEQARYELGMIKEGEVFYQFAD